MTGVVFNCVAYVQGREVGKSGVTVRANGELDNQVYPNKLLCHIRKVNRILHRFFPFQLKIGKITPLRKLSTITSVYFSLQKYCLVHQNPLAQANWMVCLILS